MPDSSKKPKIGLTLLGVWNQLPLNYWQWSNDTARRQLESLTGRKIGIFCYIKNTLNYECFTAKEIDMLRRDLDKLTPEKQLGYVHKITDDYYKKILFLEKKLGEIEAENIGALDDDTLAARIMELANVWSKVTMQIWYALLIDIWYPRPGDKANIKTIVAKARDHCGHLHERSDKIERVLYIEAAHRLHLSPRQIYFLIQPEIAEALRGKKFSRKQIQLRMKLCVESSHEGTVKWYEGREAERVMNMFAVPSVGPKTKGDLKGTPACLGKVKGVARVILLDKEFKDFKDGEILVSLQTMVHYIPVMKKSSAILTEFGGLTSHAAIVSRELKKPCIVGIKGLIASVKTGDILEVDADRGIIQKVF